MARLMVAAATTLGCWKNGLVGLFFECAVSCEAAHF